ncbi:nuclear transport factor 2 family protein [Microbacterium sp. MYb64]|uniref:nuclear transport factor 2 family protein n=1 Tax=Microbacterium sp. MYb64 TaxID=1848691 RepID=UPI0021579DD8|nr:nuclear transport factor 2 family protein [Microbacterium sp. MYb64]
MDEGGEFLEWFGTTWQAAEAALYAGDAGPRFSTWSSIEPVTLFGASRSATGAGAVRDVFLALASSYSDMTSFAIELGAAEAHGDLAYTAHREIIAMSVGGHSGRYVLRVTQAYRREDDAWRVVHRHGDQERDADRILRRRDAPASTSTLATAGSEALNTAMDDRDEFLAWFETTWQAAEAALHAGDAGPRFSTWSSIEPVTLFGAWFSASGVDDVREVFRKLGESFSDTATSTVELLAAEVSGDLAYTAHREITAAAVDGRPRSYVLRVTQVYRREDGTWKVVHRHGDEELSSMR